MATRGEQGLRLQGKRQGAGQPVARVPRVTRERRPGSSEEAPSTRGTPSGFHTMASPRHVFKILLLSFTHLLGVLASAFPGDEVNTGSNWHPHLRSRRHSRAPTARSPSRKQPSEARPWPGAAAPHAPAHAAGTLPQHTGLGNAGGPSPDTIGRGELSASEASASQSVGKSKVQASQHWTW